MTDSVLIIDDDRELCELLTQYLQLQGFSVESEHDGAQALRQLQRKPYDVLVLDIMLPGKHGLDVLRELRETSSTPVMMLTARGEDTDRIVGLELGADDYLPKPCNPRELAARLRAILRRAGGMTDQDVKPSEVRAGDTVLNSGSRTARFRDQPLSLTSAEFNLLRVLVERAGHAVDKETLSEKALGRPLAAYDRSIDVHISKIRRKLATAGAAELILSIRGLGYQFAVDD